MPFAGYDTFDSCVDKNKTKGDPKAYCGKIKHKVEDITLKENEPFSILYDPPVGSVYNEPTVPPLTMKVPDTGYPPEKPYEPYLSEPYPPLSLNYSPIPQDDQQNRNYVATGSKLESQPSMHNEEGWTANKDPPIDTQGLNINPNDIIFEPPMNETEWKEEQHPRDSDGKFGSGGGSSSNIDNVIKKLKTQDKSTTPRDGGTFLTPDGWFVGDGGEHTDTARSFSKDVGINVPGDEDIQGQLDGMRSFAKKVGLVRVRKLEGSDEINADFFGPPTSSQIKAFNDLEDLGFRLNLALFPTKGPIASENNMRDFNKTRNNFNWDNSFSTELFTETTFSDKIEKQRDLYLFGDDDKPHMVTDGNDDNDTELHIHLELPELDLEIEDIEEEDESEYTRSPLMLDLQETQVIRESIGQIRHEFDWLSDEYLDRVKKVNSEGKWYLIRASAETITDHRQEGETHRRKLDGDELHAMARTAINHSMDINHLGGEYKTDALIADSEYDKKRKEVQMLVHESDPEIIDGVRRGDITAVSINGGAPRDTKIECEDTECFNVPRGVVLGELDDIALTWVVTKQSGFRWRGKHIPYAKPGVGVTVIQPLN